MALASTLVDGEMLNASIVGAVFSTVTDVVEEIGAPSLSVADAVQKISSVGLVELESIVSVSPIAARGVPSDNVQAYVGVSDPSL